MTLNWLFDPERPQLVITTEARGIPKYNGPRANDSQWDLRVTFLALSILRAIWAMPVQRGVHDQ